MGVDPEGDLADRFTHHGEGRPDLSGQRAAVGVAHHKPLRSRPGGRAQALQRIAGIQLEAVEGMLGVEQHSLAGLHQKRDRVGDHLQVLLARGAHDLLHVQHRGLADERAGGSEAVGKDAQPLVRIRGHPSPASHAEGHGHGDLQLLPGEQLEQLALLGIGGGKADLDHVHAERVERVHHAQLLLGREAEAAPAHAVAQGGVV